MKEFDFYIVPTPIGNLEDITRRALDILSSVDVIACEDIRVTQKLLNHFNIKTKCISYHKFNEKERVNSIVEMLEQGKKFALVSDAGTPLICDPGAVLVSELKNKGFRITALPGANAIVTFLSQLSRKDETFCFVGFLPKNLSQLTEMFEKYRDFDMVFYESPNRILKTLEALISVRPDANVSLGRELTKVFEEIVTGSACELKEYFQAKEIKGEFVGVIYRDNLIEKDDLNMDESIKKLRKKGFKAKEISVILSELYSFNKNEVYERVLNK